VIVSRHESTGALADTVARQDNRFQRTMHAAFSLHRRVEKHTCEELEDEHAAAHLLEHLIPHPATTFEAPFTHIQDVVAPEDPAEHEVDQGKGQNDGAGCRVGQSYDVDQHHDADLPPISDAVWPQSCYLIPV